jgi:hypothetical protein
MTDCQEHEGEADVSHSPSFRSRLHRLDGTCRLRPPASQNQVTTQGANPDFRPGKLLDDIEQTFVEANGSPGCGFWRNACNRLLHSSGIPILHPNQLGALRMNLVLEKQPDACPKLHPQDSTPLLVAEITPSFAGGFYRFRANSMNCEIEKASGIGKCETGKTR